MRIRMIELTLLSFGMISCGAAHTDTTDPSVDTKTSTGSTSTLGATLANCPNSKPSTITSKGVIVEATLDSVNEAWQCDKSSASFIAQLESDFVHYAYNIVCSAGSSTAEKRASLWVQGFNANEPFTVQIGSASPWSSTNPNLSMQVKTSEGKLEQDSFSIDPDSLKSVAAIVWDYSVTSTAHSFSGCMEGVFQAKGTKGTPTYRASGSAKILFDVGVDALK